VVERSVENSLCFGLYPPAWSGRLTEEDARGLTPLLYGHVNPYGRFDLDMSKRLPLADATYAS
jgi:hypothetical protein